MKKLSRVPTVKACIKRMTKISIEELKTLSTADLNGILKLQQFMGHIYGEVRSRSIKSNIARIGEEASEASMGYSND